MKRLWDKILSLAASNLGLKLLSLLIAVGLWLAGHRDIERAVEVPVEFRNIPPDTMVTDNRVDYVVLRLTGPRTLVSTLDADDLKLALDLHGAKPGAASYPLSTNLFDIPRGITIARITPPVVHLRLDPVVRREFPVTVRFSSKLPAGYHITATARPPNVLVQGPAEEVRRLVAVETLPIEIEEGRAFIQRTVRLSADGKPLAFIPDQVEISVAIEEEQIELAYGPVNAQAKGFTGEYTVSPRAVRLRLSGPKRIIEHLKLDSEQVYLDLKGLPPGDHWVTLGFNLPPGVKVIEQKPQRLRVKIIKPAT